MKVTALQCRRFRNYEALTQPVDKRLNLIVGDNGQGKTNLLEALYYLSHARSHRTHRDSELVWQPPHQTPPSPDQATVDELTTQVQVQVEREGIFTGTHKVEARIVPTAAGIRSGKHSASGWQTQFRLDGQPLRTRSEVLGQLVTVSFTLSDLLLFRGTPADRRQWLDSALVQVQPLHFSALATCQRVLRQKKIALLQPSPDTTLLAVLNEQLAEACLQVTWGRLNLLHTLMPDIATGIATLSDGQEAHLMWHYTIAGMAADLPRTLPDWQGLSQDELRILFERRLHEVLAQELRQQQCLFGPQREDFSVTYVATGLAAHRFASQGQQRSLVLALKLAELAYLTRHLGEAPVLLLDDVMAELDPHRQASLVTQLCRQGQVFLTTTHLDPTIHAPILAFGSDNVAVWPIQAGQIALSNSVSSRL
jgi:DNA replication and repair protein RecF